MCDAALAIRHTCEHGDELAGFGWKMHDGRTFGDQEMNDAHNNLRLRTQFIKTPDNGGWTVRITGTPLDDKG